MTELFSSKVKLEMRVGHFLIKTLSDSEELIQAFALRFQVFQVEMIGSGVGYGLDSDRFDKAADHLGIFDQRTGRMIATCRMNSSVYTDRFYSETEFNCEALLALQGNKLEIGRVCVDRDFRKGAIILILWRAIAEYMVKTDTEILFGCASVNTLNPKETLLLYHYLQMQGKLRVIDSVSPIAGYVFAEFEELLALSKNSKLSKEEAAAMETLLPPLCRSYFEMGCYAIGSPAIDRDFKCIDFLTVLEKRTLDPALRKKMFGG